MKIVGEDPRVGASAEGADDQPGAVAALGDKAGDPLEQILVPRLEPVELFRKRPLIVAARELKPDFRLLDGSGALDGCRRGRRGRLSDLHRPRPGLPLLKRGLLPDRLRLRLRRWVLEQGVDAGQTVRAHRL